MSVRVVIVIDNRSNWSIDMIGLVNTIDTVNLVVISNILVVVRLVKNIGSSGNS